MVDVRRVTLPGVGVLHSFTTADGAEVAVVAHRTGSSDLVSRPAGARDDDDAITVRLEEEEAHTLAELLGGTRIVESIAELDELPGVPIDWVTVDDDDAIAGQAARRGARGIRSRARRRRARRPRAPLARARLRRAAGDTIVAVGPTEGIEAVFRASAGLGRHGRRRGLMLQMMLRPRWVLALLARPRDRRGVRPARPVAARARGGAGRRAGAADRGGAPARRRRGARRSHRAGRDRAAGRGHRHVRAGRHRDRRGSPERRRRRLLAGGAPRGHGCHARRPARRARLGGRPRDRAGGRRPRSTPSPGDEVTVVGRFLPSEAPIAPDEDADPFSMQTVAVAQLINVWADYDDRPVYFAYVTADRAGRRSRGDRRRRRPRQSVGAQLAQRVLRGRVGRVRRVRDLPLVPARARCGRARARRGGSGGATEAAPAASGRRRRPVAPRSDD